MSGHLISPLDKDLSYIQVSVSLALAQDTGLAISESPLPLQFLSAFPSLPPLQPSNPSQGSFHLCWGSPVL